MRLREAGVDVESVGKDEGDLSIHSQKLDSCYHPSGPVKPMNRTSLEYSDLMNLRRGLFLEAIITRLLVLLAIACFGHRTREETASNVMCC